MYGSAIPVRYPKLSNRARRKLADHAITEATRSVMVLLAVLAQKGGEVTVTQGTLDQVGTNLANLSFVIVPGANENESIVRLVDGKEDELETPFVLSGRANGMTEAEAESIGYVSSEHAIQIDPDDDHITPVEIFDHHDSADGAIDTKESDGTTEL